MFCCDDLYLTAYWDLPLRFNHLPIPTLAETLETPMYLKNSLKLAATSLMILLTACVQAPIQLSQMGSFHIGGREVVISGKPIKEVLFSPGGVPAKVAPRALYR